MVLGNSSLSRLPISPTRYAILFSPAVSSLMTINTKLDYFLISSSSSDCTLKQRRRRPQSKLRRRNSCLCFHHFHLGSSVQRDKRGGGWGRLYSLHVPTAQPQLGAHRDEFGCEIDTQTGERDLLFLILLTLECRWESVVARRHGDFVSNVTEYFQVTWHFHQSDGVASPRLALLMIVIDFYRPGRSLTSHTSSSCWCCATTSIEWKSVSSRPV